MDEKQQRSVERLRQYRTIRQHAERCLFQHLLLAEISIHSPPSGWGTIGLFEDRLYTIFKLTPVNLQFLQANLLKNSLVIVLGCVSKFKTMHFQYLFRHFCVVEPRFTSSKPSVLRLELTENLLETAHSSF